MASLESKNRLYKIHASVNKRRFCMLKAKSMNFKASGSVVSMLLRKRNDESERSKTYEIRTVLYALLSATQHLNFQR